MLYYYAVAHINKFHKTVFLTGVENYCRYQRLKKISVVKSLLTDCYGLLYLTFYMLVHTLAVVRDAVVSEIMP